MKLYETHYTAPEGLHPLRIKGKRYDVGTADLIVMDKGAVREVYRKKTGEFFLHILIAGIGHYLAPLTEMEAEAEIFIILENGGCRMPSYK